MFERRLHLHSMLVHSVLALLPLAAVAFVVVSAHVRVAGLEVDVWRFLLRAALVLALLAALPSTVSGILERSHMYVRWHRTHRLKLIFSLALIGIVVAELAILVGEGGSEVIGSPVGVMVVAVNTIVALALGALGLKMSLGRQAMARTSYQPDLLKAPPVDVLAVNAELQDEPADLIDILQEMAP